MKILIANCPYSEIPRLVKEGKIKVGTRVKACEDQEKYPNAFTITMPKGTTGMIKELLNDAFVVKSDERQYEAFYDKNYFLDILEDEEEEIPCKICNNRIAWSGKKDDFCSVEHAKLYAKPLSFDEPLTKEAVGKIVQIQVSAHPYLGYRIFGLGDDGELYAFEDGTGISFGIDNPSNIEPQEPRWEKLTGKKIKS